MPGHIILYYKTCVHNDVHTLQTTYHIVPDNYASTIRDRPIDRPTPAHRQCPRNMHATHDTRRSRNVCVFCSTTCTIYNICTYAKRTRCARTQARARLARCLAVVGVVVGNVVVVVIRNGFVVVVTITTSPCEWRRVPRRKIVRSHARSSHHLHHPSKQAIHYYNVCYHHHYKFHRITATDSRPTARSSHHHTKYPHNPAQRSIHTRHTHTQKRIAPLAFDHHHHQHHRHHYHHFCCCRETGRSFVVPFVPFACQRRAHQRIICRRDRGSQFSLAASISKLTSASLLHQTSCPGVLPSIPLRSAPFAVKHPSLPPNPKCTRFENREHEAKSECNTFS